MKHKILDNFLTNDQASFIEDTLTSQDFQWFYQKNITIDSDTIRNKREYYFTHTFYSKYSWNSEWGMQLLNPILEKISPKAIIRIKANFYPMTETIMENELHSDYKFKHNGAIYYVNSNDGFTILEDGTKIESVKNRLLIFDSSQLHCSTHCTDQHGRININFNYF